MDSAPSFLMMLSRYERSCNWTSMMWLAKIGKAWCCALQKISESVFALVWLPAVSAWHKKRHAVKSKISPKPNLCRPLCGSNCPHLPSTLWRHSMKRASVGILQLPFCFWLPFTILHCAQSKKFIARLAQSELINFVWSQPPSNRK